MNKFDYVIDGDIYEMGWTYLRELWKGIPGVGMEYLDEKLFNFLTSSNLNLSDRQRIRIQRELIYDFMEVVEYESN